jgi:hypothetical protein
MLQVCDIIYPITLLIGAGGLVLRQTWPLLVTRR